MSYKAEFNTFFESAAGISLLTWLQEQRTTEHEKAEDSSDSQVAFGHSQVAKAYREILEHIDSVQIGMGKGHSSSGVDSVNQPD